MAELWRIREEASKKGRPLVRLRAEELRGKLMGYYVDKKQTLNVNKTLGDLTEDELIQKQRSILEQYSHFIDLKEPQKKIVEAEIRGDRKAAKYKEGFDLAVKQLRENGISNHEAERLRKIAEEPVEDGSALVEYNKRREKERRNGKKR